MAKKGDNEKKEGGFTKIIRVTESIAGIVEKTSVLFKNQVEGLKKKLIGLGIAFGIIFIALLIFLVGLGQFLTHRFTLEPGIGAIILGGSLLVLALLYLAIKR